MKDTLENRALKAAQRALACEKNPDGSYAHAPEYIDCVLAIFERAINREVELSKENQELKKELDELKKKLAQLAK